MQTAPGYPSDLTIAEPSARVTVNGQALSVESVTVTRELSSSLPQQVVTVSGMTAADGDVEWLVGGDVAARSPHPWSADAFPPRPSDTVTVDMGYGDALVRQLTGKIDGSTGSVEDGAVQSTIVDAIDKLETPVSFPPHMSVMPPWDEGGEFLTVNNSPIFTTDRVLRACGFNATSPVDTGCILSVPLMGSAWPEVGRVTSAGQQGLPAFPPSFNASQWGLACNSIEASYTPDLSNWPTGRLDKNFQITLDARNVTATEGEWTVRAWWGLTRVSVAVTSDRRILGVCFDGTVGTVVCAMSAAVAFSADRFTLRVNPGGNFTIYANNGATATGTTTLPAAMTTTNLDRVQITSPHITGVHCGGVQVGFSTAPTYDRPRTAILTPSASNLGLQVMPAINGRKAIDILKEQAEAECAVWTIDEYGVLRWTNRNILTSAPESGTVRAREVFRLGWDSNSKGVRDAVELLSKQFKITRFPVSSVTLYQGSGESLQSGQSTTDIIEPGADESWFNIDPPLYWTHAGINRGERTMVGGIVSKDGSPDVWGVNAGKFSYAWENINSETVALTHTAGTLASGETLILKTSESDPLLRPFRRDKNLPIIRGKGRARAFDVVTRGVHLGPANAARLEHEVGPWVQDPLALQELADWLSAWVSAPRPILRDLDVVPDPRRQLGDIVWVEGDDTLRVRLKVLLTKISTTVRATKDSHEMDQIIGGRVLEAINPVTNEQFDLFHAGRTNTQLDTLWAGGTNAQLDANPLGRG